MKASGTLNDNRKCKLVRDQLKEINDIYNYNCSCIRPISYELASCTSKIQIHVMSQKKKEVISIKSSRIYKNIGNNY